jgi:glycosyltransferase involved in cell wall biosynthesis
LRVLHFNRDHSAWIGGDAVQVENTVTALQRRWIDCTYSCDPNVDLSSYDLVHIYHLTHPWGIDMALRCRGEGKPYIMSAIYYPQGGHVLAEIVDNSEVTIALSQVEKDEMIQILGCSPEKVIVIPNGVNRAVFYPGDPTTESGVVNNGQIIETKGVLLLAQSCARLGIPYTHIGQFHNDGYGQMCMPLIHTHHQDLTPAQVANVLRTCRLYVCPSLGERQSLGVLEGAACGLPVVDSIFNRGAGLLPSSIVIDPRDPEALDYAILTVYKNAPQNVDPVPGWDDVAAQILEVYNAV